MLLIRRIATWVHSTKVDFETHLPILLENRNSYKYAQHAFVRKYLPVHAPTRTFAKQTPKQKIIAHQIALNPNREQSLLLVIDHISSRPRVCLQSHTAISRIVKGFVNSISASSTAIEILVADSHKMQSQLLVSALRRHPEFHVLACFMNTDAVLRAIAASKPRVALMTADHQYGGWQGLATLRRVHLTYPEISKIVLVEAYDRDIVVNIFRAVAKGLFCFTQVPFRALCKCIQRVANGQIWANNEQLHYLLDVVTQVPSLRVVNAGGEYLLTPREEQIIALVSEGLSNHDIARELRLSEHTVKKYMSRIFDKLGISTRVELVLYAVNHGDSRPAEWVAGGE